MTDTTTSTSAGSRAAAGSAPACMHCGLAMTLNPHPNAGQPNWILTVNAKWVCIPCLTANRHRWAQRALRYEDALNKIAAHQARTSLGEAMDLRRMAEDALRESPNASGSAPRRKGGPVSDLTANAGLAAAPGSACLTVRQPWAWGIIYGGKDVENRTWPTRFRGRVWIHAAATMTRDEAKDALAFIYGFDPDLCMRMTHVDIVLGAIIGSVEIVDCVQVSDSPWFAGPYGFVLRNPQPISPVKARGALGFWKWSPNSEVNHRPGAPTSHPTKEDH